MHKEVLEQHLHNGSIPRGHGIEGHIHRHFKHLIKKQEAEDFKNIYFNQWAMNEVYCDLLVALDQECSHTGIYPLALKGITLLRDIYPDLGTRPMSDLDLLITGSEKFKLEQCLLVLGFAKVHVETKWSANNFKQHYHGTWRNTPLTIEVHEYLFSQFRAEQDFFARAHEFLPYHNIKKLNKEDTVLHLIGHLSYQHTFLKFFWSLDVLLYLQKYAHDIDWKKLSTNAQKLGLWQAHRMTLQCLGTHFDLTLPVAATKYFHLDKKMLTTYLLTPKFLLRKRNWGLRYFTIKHLTKDSLWQAIYYDILWGLSKIGIKGSYATK